MQSSRGVPFLFLLLSLKALGARFPWRGVRQPGTKRAALRELGLAGFHPGRQNGRPRRCGVHLFGTGFRRDCMNLDLTVTKRVTGGRTRKHEYCVLFTLCLSLCLSRALVLRNRVASCTDWNRCNPATRPLASIRPYSRNFSRRATM